jgi:hypothetical protein
MEAKLTCNSSNTAPLRCATSAATQKAFLAFWEKSMGTSIFFITIAMGLVFTLCNSEDYTPHKE